MTFSPFILSQYLLTNAVWLLLLGGTLFFCCRYWFRFAPIIHLLWVLLLIKILLPPLFSVELQQAMVQKSEEISATTIMEQSPWENQSPPISTVPNSNPVETPSVEITIDAMPIDATPISTQLIEKLPEPLFSSDSPMANHTAINTQHEPELAHEEISVIPSTSNSPHQLPTSEMTTIFNGLMVIWVIGSLTVLVVAAWRIGQFGCHVRTMTPAGETTQQLVAELCHKFGLRENVTVYQLNACVPPMVWAFCSRSKILFPKALLEQLSTEEITLLLAHELAHIKRRDHWVRYLELICTILYWWHPMLWLARRELREAEELCCDAWATWLFPRKGREYGLALMNTIDYLAEHKPLTLPSTGSGMSMKETKRRIEMIMKSNLKHTISWPVRIAVLLLAMVIFPISAKLVAKQEEHTEHSEQTKHTEHTGHAEHSHTNVAPAATEEKSEYVDETLRLKVTLIAPAETPGVLWSHLIGADVELWDLNRVTGEKKLVAKSITDSNGRAEFNNVVRPIDARWFDQKTRQKLDKPVDVKEYHVYQVSAKHSEHPYVSLKQNVDIIPSYYPKKREEIDTAFQESIEEEIPMFRAITIPGVVTSSSGMPISGAKVSATATMVTHLIQQNVREVFDVLECTTDLQGRFKIENIPFDNNRGIMITIIEVTAEGYQSRTERLIPGKTTLLFVLPPEEKKEEIPSTQEVAQENNPNTIDANVVEQETVTVKVMDSSTKLPIEGIDLAMQGCGVINQLAQSFHPEKAVSDKNGEASFTIKRLKSLRQNQYRVFSDPNTDDYRILVHPTPKDGKVYVSTGFIDIPYVKHDVHPDPEDLNLYVSEGHLLVGRVLNAETNQPLAKTDDEKPIMIGLSEIGWNDQGLVLGRPYERVAVDESGIFKFYVPEGVSLPYILDNGADKLWLRTINHEQWQKEGILIKPGKITSIEFLVKPRLDTYAHVGELPVLEEQSAIAKLVMLGINGYTLDEQRHVHELCIFLRTPLKEQWPLIREFKHLKRIDIRSCFPLQFTDEDIKQILELPELTTLITGEHPENIRNGGMQTIEGRENIQQYFKEEFPKIREYFEKQQSSGMGMMGGGMGMSPMGGMPTMMGMPSGSMPPGGSMGVGMP